MQPLTKEHLLKFGAKDESSQTRIRFSFKITVATLYINFDKVKGCWWFEYETDGKIMPLPRELKHVEEFLSFFKEFTGKELKGSEART